MHLWSDMEYDIVAKQREFIVVLTALGPNLDMAHLWEVLLQGGEEGWGDEQFLLLGHPLMHTLPQLLYRQRGWGLMQLNGGMEGLEERKAAHISHKDRAPWLHQMCGTFQDVQCIVNARKELYNGVENNRIEGFCLHTREVVRRSLEKCHLWQRVFRPRQLQLERAQHHLREVGTPILNSVRGNAKQQQTRPTTDLQNTDWSQREKPLDSMVHPLAHLLRWDR